MPNSFARLQLMDPSPRARRLLWHLHSMGQVTLDSPDYHEGMDKPGAHLFWVRSGAGTLEVPDRTYELATGPRCWLVDMKKPRTHAPTPGTRIVNSGFRFGGPDLESWREELGEDCAFDLDRPDFDNVRESVRNLARLVQRKPAGFEWDIHLEITRVLGVLLKARRVFDERRIDRPAALARTIGLVMSDPARDWRVAELAQAAGASRSGLQKLFKTYQGECIHDFLLRVRLDQARQLLCDERLTVKEVAARLNFSSEFYFSRFFRKRTGMSPRQHRESVWG